ncbi:MAG: cupin, partial [Burkholderiales bacterium PBB5]
GLRNFGVNLATLSPGAVSAPRHAHTRQDEFVYVLSGEPTLVCDSGQTRLRPGMCAGFAAGTGNAHRLVNETSQDCSYLVVGDRSADDNVAFPDDDLSAITGPDGTRRFVHKDGTPYP